TATASVPSSSRSIHPRGVSRPAASTDSPKSRASAASRRDKVTVALLLPTETDTGCDVDSIFPIAPVIVTRTVRSSPYGTRHWQGGFSVSESGRPTPTRSSAGAYRGDTVVGIANLTAPASI